MTSEQDHSIHERIATLETHQVNMSKDIDINKKESIWLKRGVFGVLIALVLDLAKKYTGGGL